MDSPTLSDALDKASLFDLWRLKAAIARALEDPHKNDLIRTKLYLGQAIRYFDPTENREIPGRIVAIKRSRALIRHDHDQKLWNIPFYMINLQRNHVDIHTTQSHQKIRRDILKAGDSVGYKSRTHREVYGVVEKLNPKTATVRLTNGEQWNVSYGLLFYVIDTQQTSIAGTVDCQVTTAVPTAEEKLDVADTV